MIPSFLDICRFTATSTGTGDFVDAGAVTGYQNLAGAGAVNGDYYRYRAESADLSQWEIGYGLYTSATATLARTGIIASSNAGAAVNFTTIPQVGVVLLAEDIIGRAGDVIISFDAAPLPGFVELDGSTITGGAASYPGVANRYSWMVSAGNIILPDMRGRFLRSWAHGSANDPDAATRTARAGDGLTGDYPGTYQADNTRSHYHSATGGNWAMTGGPTPGYLTSGGGGGSSPNTTSVGGNETRGININVMFQMRLA